MGITRDFSKSSIENFRSIARNTYEDWNLFNWFSDTQLTEELSIRDNIKNLNHYHEVMMDKHTIGENKLDQIIIDIDNIDKSYSKIFETLDSVMEAYLIKIRKLSNVISPSYITTDTKTLKNHLSDLHNDFESDKFKIVFGTDNIEEIMKKVSLKDTLTYQELQALIKLASMYPETPISPSVLDKIVNSFANFLDENEYKLEITSTVLTQIGLGSYNLGNAIIKGLQVAGPEGINSFVMYNPSSSNAIQQLSKWVGNSATLEKVGRYSGKALGIAGFGIGMWDDINNDDKTVGEALVHQGAAIGLGAGVAFLVFGSNPVGWAAIGAAGVAIAVGSIFESMYENNIFGIQDGLDFVGGKVDDCLEWGSEKASDFIDSSHDFVDSVGEAISDIGETINPFNWF